MSKFHSIVSRRDFMKNLGLAGAGMIGGAALLTAPKFHDLDEMIASEGASYKQKRPWYVKERELFNPTADVDWDIMNRFDRMNEGHQQHTDAYYYPTARVQNMVAVGNAVTAQNTQNGVRVWILNSPHFAMLIPPA